MSMSRCYLVKRLHMVRILQIVFATALQPHIYTTVTYIMSYATTNLVRRVTAANEHKLNIGLTLERSSVELVNAIRSRYSPPGVELPHFNTTRLFYGIDGRHIDCCKRLLSNFATQGSSFPIELNHFGRLRQRNCQKIAVELSSHQMMAIHVNLSRKLGFILPELAWWPPTRRGLSAHVLSSHEKPFNPATILCALGPGEEEVSKQIFDELNDEYPDGLGSAYATGLSLLLIPPQPRNLKAIDPTICPRLIEFPFTGSW